MSAAPSPGVLIIDGLYMAGITHSTKPITIDYARFAGCLLPRAGVTQEEGRYFVDRTPSLDPRFPAEELVIERVRKRHGFHTALKRQKGFELILAPPRWYTTDCGTRAMDDRQVPGALMALLARLLLKRPDIPHYVLVAASSAYIPMVEFVRAQGVFVTLAHMTDCDELRHAADAAIALCVAELARR